MNTRLSPEIQLKLENAYKVLGFSQEANYEEVKAVYKKLILEFHPDRLKMNAQKLSKEELEEKFKEIQASFEVIEQYADKKVIKKANPETLDNLKEVKVESFYEHHDYAETPNIAKDALVSRESRLRVYLPIYVGTIIPICTLGIRIQINELEDAETRFLILRDRINQALSWSDYQVGIDQNEVSNIINQHSWYKDPYIAFVGCVEILLPLYHLNERSLESPMKATPYFSIKKNSEIQLSDITAFFATNNIMPMPTLALEDLIEVAKKGEIVNSGQTTEKYILEKQFDYNQDLSSFEILAEALQNLKTEYQQAFEYDRRREDILDNIIKLQEIHHEMIPYEKKLEEIDTLHNSNGAIRNRDKRYRIIEQKLKEFCGNLVSEHEIVKRYHESTVSGQPLIQTPINETKTNETLEAPFKETLIEEKIENENDNENEKAVQVELIQQKNNLRAFLANEIVLIMNRVIYDKKSYLNFNLFGWSNNSNNNDQNDKIFKLKVIANWLSQQKTLSAESLDTVYALVHSVCAIKRNVYLPKTPTSQTNFETTFHYPYKTKPVLDQEQLKKLENDSDVEHLLENIARSKRQQLLLQH